MTTKDLIPHLFLRETFRDRQSVVSNGAKITGNPSISKGLLMSNPTTNYLSVSDFPSFEPNFSIHIKLSLDSNSGGRVIGSEDGGVNSIRSYIEASNNRHYLYIKIGSSVQYAPYQDLSPFIASGDTFSMSWSFSYNGTNTVIRSFLNGVLVGTSSGFAGKAVKAGRITLGYWDNTNTGAEGTVYEFQIYNSTLDEKDFLKIHNNLLSKELPFNNSILYLPCDDEYTNSLGNRVTSVKGTSGTSEGILGDGTTLSTFPTLGADRMWTFDGGDYINLGTNSNYTLNITNPFSIGCLCLITSSTGAFTGVITKVDNLGIGGGEFVFQINKGLMRPRFILLDNVTGGYKIIEASNGSVVTNVLHSIIFTYDGSQTYTTATMHCFIDGEDVTASITSNGSFSAVYETSKNFKIGHADGSYNYIDGRIGFPFVVRKELSPLQVQILHDRMLRWGTV